MSKFCPRYPAPLKGKLAQLMSLFKKNDSVLESLTERAYQMHLGEVSIGGHTLYTVNDPVCVRHVLVEHQANYPKHRYMADLLAPLLGRSIFTTNGETWKKQRTLMEPAFEQTRMEIAFPLMRDAVLALLNRLENLPDGAECDVDAQTTHVTADVILRTIFSVPMEGKVAEKIFAAFVRYQHSAPQATMPKYQSRWRKSSKQEKLAQQAADEIRQLLLSLIEPRWNAWKAGTPGPERDILRSLLEAKEAGTGRQLTLDELVNEVAVLFLAGHETSASALAWALYLLARDETVQTRVHAEVDEILGDQLPELGHLRQMDLVRRVFRETLRLFPPIGFLPREAKTPDTLRGKSVKPESTLVISPWLIHRHRQYWERPDEFDPDRFLTDAGRASASQAYLPFSLGPRVCVGASFALQEAALVLAMLCKKYRFEFVGSEEPMPVSHLTTRAEKGIHLKLWRR